MMDLEVQLRRSDASPPSAVKYPDEAIIDFDISSIDPTFSGYSSPGTQIGKFAPNHIQLLVLWSSRA